MRKLLAVPVLLLALLLCSCGGGSSSTTIPPKHPDHYNVMAYWVHNAYVPPWEETLAFTGQKPHLRTIPHAVQAADFTVSPEGIYLEIGNESAFFEAEIVYSTKVGGITEFKHLPWNGAGAVQMSRTMRTAGGKLRRFNLRRVDAHVYDPRYDEPEG